MPISYTVDELTQQNIKLTQDFAILRNRLDTFGTESINNIVLTNPQNGQALLYRNGNFINGNVSTGGGTGGGSTNATDLVSGTLGDARLSANVTLLGNTFNTANKLLKLDSTGKLPALDGSLLTNIPTDSSIINGSSKAPSGTAVYSALGAKVDKVSGKQLTTEDYSTAEKTKLGTIASGATVNSPDTSLLNRSNHTGNQSADTITDGVTNKAFTGTEKTKLGTVASGATVNSSDAVLFDRSNHTGTQNADTITDGVTNKVYSATDKTKLTGIAIGATANSSDAQLRDRSSHTGSQAIGTISGLQSALDNKAMPSDIASAVSTLKGGVSVDGDNLAKVYSIALGAISESTVANIAARNAYNVTSLPKHIFVLDDGDGNWATYKATTTGTNATYVKISDYDTVNTSMSSSSIKASYESNSDTNAFTDALKTKLVSIASGATANSSDSILLARANHTGTQSADTIIDGTTNKVYSGADKTKLSNIAAGATVNSSDSTLLSRSNHTGTQNADTIVDGTTNKVYTITEKTKLSNIASGATANSSDATLLSRGNHTGTQNADTLTDGTTNKAFLATERTKLSGIATGATLNSTDSTLLSRANHTGNQLASTISDFNSAALAAAPAESATSIGAVLNTATAKTSIVDADLIGVGDSAASNILKKQTWGSFKVNIKGYYDTVTSSVSNKTIDGTLNTLSNIPAIAIPSSESVTFDPTTKQDLLVSGTNIKTIGGVSILGSGNIASMSGGGGDVSTQLAALGAPIKFLGFGTEYFFDENASMNIDLYSGGGQIFTAIYLTAGSVITGAIYRMRRQGNYTASSNFNGAGLYSVSGGVLTLQRISANLPDVWKAASSSFVTIPFTSVYTVPTTGIYYVSNMYSSIGGDTVIPRLVTKYGGFSAQLNSGSFANGLFINGIGGYSASMLTTVNVSDIDRANLPDPTWVVVY